MCLITCLFYSLHKLCFTITFYYLRLMSFLKEEENFIQNVFLYIHTYKYTHTHTHKPRELKNIKVEQHRLLLLFLFQIYSLKSLYSWNTIVHTHTQHPWRRKIKWSVLFYFFMLFCCLLMCVYVCVYKNNIRET